MRKYEQWEKYPYNTYGNSIVISELISWYWMERHLLASYAHWIKSSLSGHETFHGNIVGYQSWHLPDGHFMISFHDPENKRLLIKLRPDIVVEADPFGPDKCPACEKRSPSVKNDHRPPSPLSFTERLRWLFGR